MTFKATIYQQQLWAGKNEWFNKLQIIEELLIISQIVSQHLCGQKL